MTTSNNINPTFVEYEGFTYLTYNGEFFKGCKRCGGSGHYSHDGEHSRCYACDNTSSKLGEAFDSKEAAEKWCHGKAVRLAQRAKLRAKNLQAAANRMHENQQALLLSAPDVYEFLMNIVIEDDTQANFATYEEWAAQYDINAIKIEKDSFIRSLAETLRWVAPSKPFTVNMINAMHSAMERRSAREAHSAAHPAPTGRVEVTGEILSTKVVQSDFGTAYKILVKDDSGFSVYVSLPKAQADEAYEAFEEVHGPTHLIGYGVWFSGSENEPELYKGLKGRRIKFTAKLEPSAGDAAFAYGSRPSKGSWL